MNAAPISNATNAVTSPVSAHRHSPDHSHATSPAGNVKNATVKATASGLGIALLVTDLRVVGGSSSPVGAR